MNSVRDKIHEAANQAKCSFLDTPLLVDRDIINAAAPFVAGKSIECYVDIPIRNVRALFHENDWHQLKRPNWRDMARTLHCDDWGNQVFSYFETELLENWFPAPNSRMPLKITLYGNLAYCSCGNHRIPAQICWLAAKFGENAVLKKAKTIYFPLCDLRLKQVKELVGNSDSKIYLYREFQDGKSTPLPFFVPKDGALLKVARDGQVFLYHFCDRLYEIYPVITPSRWQQLREKWQLATGRIQESSLPSWRRKTLISADGWWEIPMSILKHWWNEYCI